VDPDPEPDPDWIRIQRLHGSGSVLGIRIGSGFSDFMDPDPYWESGSGSRGKKIKKYQCKNALFSYFKKNFYHYKSIK
jgi:hypothetical protein